MEDSTQAKPYTRRLGGDATYWTMGVYLLTWLAEGKDTNGLFALAEVVIPKGAGEPPPHTHTGPRGRGLLHPGGRVHLSHRRTDRRGGTGRLRVATTRDRA